MGRRAIPMSERQHGLTGTYQAGCRCDDCKAAQAQYARERYHARKAGDVRRPGVAEHGTRAMYATHGCRCDKCKAAEAEYRREYDKRRRAGHTSKAPEAGSDVLAEIRIPVSCPNCGGEVVAQTSSATTSSGMRVTQMLRCSVNGCNRQWQFIGTLMSLSGAEYMGAA